MKTKVLFLFAMLAILSAKGEAQESIKRFGFELSAGPSLSSREVPSGKLEKGIGFEGIFNYNFMAHTGVYAGWGWNKFSSKLSFAGKNMGFEETGYLFGLQFKHPIDGFRSSYYLRAGGLYNHIEIENKSGVIIADSGHGLGWQLAAGFEIPITSACSLSTGVKFNSLSGDVEIEGTETDLLNNYISVRLGIMKKF